MQVAAGGVELLDRVGGAAVERVHRDGDLDAAAGALEQRARGALVDAAKRRGPLRKKVGEGLSVEEFRAGVEQKRIGHVGLRESALLIARGLGWKIDDYVETIDPVTGADGKCLGIRQRGSATVGGQPKIELALDMYVGAPNPHDRVQLEADPPMDVTVAGGTQGDRATVGTTVNALARMRSAPRGFVTVGEVFV